MILLMLTNIKVNNGLYSRILVEINSSDISVKNSYFYSYF